MSHENYRRKAIALIACPLILIFSSCATICGGSRYYAMVTVKDHPNAKISYDGSLQGKGYAMFKVKRSRANQFSVYVKEDSCSGQSVNFTGRTFRGWAFAGSIVGFTGVLAGIPLPWGVGMDLATGAVWKPDTKEPGIKKEDYKHFEYSIDYTGCPSREGATPGK
jgi:hypothetical protein